MTDIKRDVDFTVNVGDRRITTVGFGVLAVLAAHVRSKARVTKFFSNDEVLARFPSIAGLVDPITLASAQAFAQKGEAGRLEVFAVIRQMVDNVVLDLPAANAEDRGDVVTVTVTQAIAGYNYFVDILGGTGPVRHLATASDTTATIAAGLVTEINADTSAVTAADIGGGQFTLTADVVDTAMKIAFWNWDNSPGGAPDFDDHTAALFTATGGYNVFVNEVLHTITSSSSVLTAAQIADFMAAWIELVGTTGLLEYGATGNTDGTLDIELAPVEVDYLLIDEGKDFDIVFDDGDADSTKALGRGTLLYHAPSTTETVAETLSAAKDEDNDTYSIGSLYVGDADISELASAIAPLAKIHPYITEALDVGDPTDDTDIMSVLKALALDRSFGTFRKDATTFFEFAQNGDRLPTIPGTSTWKFKTLVNQAPDDLTEAFENAVLAKNGNVYTDQGGSGTTAEGTMASGRFIDTQRSADYLEARTDEAFLAVNKAEPKVDIETEYQIIYGAILDGLYDNGGKFNGEGVTAAILDPVNQEFYRRTIPTPAQLSDNDRATRNVPGITVETRFSGAVHKVTGTINVSV